jgi:hypothetical protein
MNQVNELDIFEDVEARIQSLMTDNNACHTSLNGALIDCTIYARRQRYIIELHKMLKDLAGLSKKVTKELEDVSSVHAADTNAISELVGVTPDKWTTVTHRKPSKKFLDAAKQGGKAELPGAKKDMTFIPITASAGIYARVVDTPLSVLADGVVYYLRTAGHFAVRVGPLFLHGSIGIIYDSTRELTKIKYCQYGSRCININTCTYYHDPLEFPGSRDVKNFAATSFLYNGTNDRRGGRRIGSRDRFDADILQVQPEDIKTYLDQVAHDFFCAVLISQMQKTK